MKTQKQKKQSTFFKFWSNKKENNFEYQEDCVNCENATEYYQEVPKSSI